MAISKKSTTNHQPLTTKLHIALYQPEIPPNTGNIIRLCANTGCMLHLIHPMGFNLEDKHLKRAGLDYHDLTDVYEYQNYETFLAALNGKRLIACSSKGTRWHSIFEFKENDVLLFGPETRGLPPEILAAAGEKHTLRIPMQKGNRSLNLSNAVAVIVYEAWRQLGYPGAV